MPLTIICIAGPANTGKSKTIREFTAKYLKYERAEGDVLGVFPMPQAHYAVGVNGSGDNVDQVSWGLSFLNHYRGLRVIIVASHTPESLTYQLVERFAKKANATLRCVPTEKLDSTREINAAIGNNVKTIRRLMPGRGG